MTTRTATLARRNHHVPTLHRQDSGMYLRKAKVATIQP